MRSKGKSGQQIKVVAPASLTPREASGSTFGILSVTVLIVGVLFWRARRSDKRNGDSSQVRAQKSAPAKTQGGRRVSSKKKSKSQKQVEAQEKDTKKKKGQAQDDGGASVLYTNHRYFKNPNGGAVPLAAPTAQPK